MLTVYLKPTNFCNVGCDHCFLSEEMRAQRFQMTDETLIQALAVAKAFKGKSADRRAYLVWHGGEPLSLPVDYFWHAGEVIDRHFGDAVEGFQSSLIPFKPEFIELFKARHHSAVGSSLDFSQRKFNGSNDLYRSKWMERVDLLRAEDIAVMPIMVPTKAEVGRESQIVDWLVDHGFDYLHMERYLTYGLPEKHTLDAPTNREHQAFAINLFDTVMRRMDETGEAVGVNLLMAVIGGVTAGRPGDKYSGQCAANYLVVEPNGDVHTCPNRAEIEPACANVHDGADAVFKSEGRRKWIRIQNLEHKSARCSTCEYYAWCKSACPMANNPADPAEDECAGYKGLIDHVRAFVEDADNREIVAAYMQKCQERRNARARSDHRAAARVPDGGYGPAAERAAAGAV